jgi:hypothetical protein
MKIIDSTGEMSLDNEKIATTEDINSIASAMLTEDGFSRWCGAPTGSDGIADGDTCERVVAAIRSWASADELNDDAIRGA